MIGPGERQTGISNEGRFALVSGLSCGRTSPARQLLWGRGCARLDDTASMASTPQFHEGHEQVRRLDGACCPRTVAAGDRVLAWQQTLAARFRGDDHSVRAGWSSGARGENFD